MKLNRTFLRCLLRSALFLLPAVSPAQAPGAYTITTFAGTGTAGFAGDGAAAASAQLNFPSVVTLDSAGNLYIADSLNSRVRKITADGNITTVAGNGTNGFTGDGSTATSAELYHPTGLAVDSSGNIYIADTHNHVVRKVTSAGTISTFAGTGAASFSGDGAAASQATLNTPMGLALDSAGNLYIADTFNHRIRKVATDGTISTVAGSGEAGSLGDGGQAIYAALDYPQGVAVDAAGNLYIADTANGLVRKVATDGTISTFAGHVLPGDLGDGGLATSATLFYPKSLALDGSGNLYISDSFNSRIRIVTASGMIATIAGNGTFGATGDGGPAVSAQLNFPWGVAVNAAGDVYVADNQNSRIRLLAPISQPGGASEVTGVITVPTFGGSSALAPGSWIEIHGSNLATNSRMWSAADFAGGTAPTSLDGTRVTIGGRDTFLAYISPSLLEVHVAADAPTGQQQITVTTAGGTSAPYAVTVNATQPGLFAPPSFNIGGKQYAGAVFADGTTFALPIGSVSGVTSRPAHPGENITLYGVGFGAVTPSPGPGQVVEQLNMLNLPVQIFFGQTPATVTYSGLAPGAIGLYQFNLVVPSVPAGDAVPLTFTLGGVNGQQALYIAVGN